LALYKIEAKTKPYKNLSAQKSYTVFVCAACEREAEDKAREAILQRTHGEAEVAALKKTLQYVIVDNAMGLWAEG
jgi:predicted metal-binding protein